ncbi:MAG: SUMF1/EgtB/PvdO family nonheme iron enzyme [Ruminiclostridium sp.]|nr:SUMF1/EgtB/PvdO family nonheme iron enzyme [Ruminiclostridium sp.]
MSNFDIANIALQAVCPGNEMKYDDKGFPSIVVKVPKQTWAQLGVGPSTETFPAWIINGREVDCFYFSKYQNVGSNERAYSLPAQDPKTNIPLDTAINYCVNKGQGWHVATRLEWMAIALWCLKNGTQPKGNNNYGKDISETTYKAVPSMARDSSGRVQRVATGTGPLSWSHDGTVEGIWDMNGNIWEWQGGIRLVKGELQVISNDGLTFGNDAADSDNPQGASSSLWRAIDGTTGALIVPNGQGTTSNSLKLEWTGSVWKWITGTPTAANMGSHNCDFEAVTVDAGVCETAQHYLMALGMLKSDNTAGIYNGDGFWADSSQDERAFFSGGHWFNGAHYGVFAVNGNYARSLSLVDRGFRAAYVDLPTV